MIGLGRPMAMNPNLPEQAINDPDFAIEVNIKSTGFEILDKVGMLDLNWYEVQLARMGRGQSPKTDLSGWGVLFHTFATIGRYAFRKRRA